PAGLAPLRGRKRALDAARRPADVGAPWRNPSLDPSVPLLGAVVGRRGVGLSLGRTAQSPFLPDAPRAVYDGRAHRLSPTVAPAFPAPARHPALGRVARPPQPAAAWLSRPDA